MTSSVMPSTVSVAARPRLVPGVPVLPLRDGTVQVGCDPDRGVRLPAGGSATHRFLRDLTGDHTPEELSRRAGLSPQAVDDLLAALAEHRLLAARPESDVPLHGLDVARVVGDVPWVDSLVAEMLDRGVGVVHVVDPTGRAATTPLGRTRRYGPAPAATDRVRVVDYPERSRLPPGTPTVIVSSRLEVAAETIEALVRHDDPHVLARPRPEGVLLGPFVVPGRTSCTACADLARATRDPSWPEQLATLARTRAVVPASLVGWAVTTLVAQLACWASGGAPDLVDRTVEMGLPDWRQQWRAWRPHPGCGCR